MNGFSQSKKETVYLFFDSANNEKCKVEVEFSSDNDGKLDGYSLIKKYRKEVYKKNITFYICKESFILDIKDKIDTCSTKYLNKIHFDTIETIEKKRVASKHINVFKNSVFQKIYIVEKLKDKIIKYPVIWTTDLVEH